MFYFALHSIVVVSWAIFLLQFIKAIEYSNFKEGFLFGILSLFFLILTFILGGKLINLNPDIIKSGGWLHLKITLAAILGIENIVYLILFFKKKSISNKILEISYWISYILFMFILFLTFFRPF